MLNGQASVCAKLLRLGSNPNRADVGGNTLVHYAAAYGWLHCLRLLVEAGAAPHRSNSSRVGAGHGVLPFRPVCVQLVT